MAVNTQRYQFKGIPKIEIPLTVADFATEADCDTYLGAYLSKVVSKHKVNAEKIRYFHNFVYGDQDVKSKTRLYQTDSQNNNQVVVNHAYAQLNFKVGFLVGDKRRFTERNATLSDDIKVLDTFLADSNFYAEDKALKEWVYSTGIGITMVQPRTDIIDENGAYKADYDADTQSPFVVKTLSPIDNFNVYSTQGEPLFSVSIAKKLNKTTLREVTVYQVWTRSFYFEYDAKFNKLSEFTEPQIFDSLPFVEQCYNEQRIGLVENARDLFNLANELISASADASVDSANVVLVFQGVDASIAEKIPEMKKMGAIVLPSDTVNGKRAGVDTIKIEFDITKVKELVDMVIEWSYDINGVPMPSGHVTSGGDTGEARMLGGGWTNAYSIIKGEIQTLNKADVDQLRLILKVCRTVPNTKLDKISVGEIDIKYSIIANDNTLSKAQAARYLYEMGMPHEMILQLTGLSLDAGSDGKLWADADVHRYDKQQTPVAEVSTEEDDKSEYETEETEEETDKTSE